MSGPAAPRVSVGICAHNEARNVGHLLSRLRHEAVAEIIVVASGCSDQTEAIVDQAARSDPRIRLLSEKNRRGKTAAFNRILQTFVGDVLVALPADVLPLPHCIERLVASLEDGVGVVGGIPVPQNPRGQMIDEVSRFIWDLHNRTLVRLSLTSRLRHTSGEVFAMRRGVVDRLPDDAVNDDSLVALYATRGGWRVIVREDARVEMMGPRTVRDYLVQRSRVVYGHLQSKRLVGAFPSVVEFESFRKPRLALGLVREVLHSERGRAVTLLVTVILEILAVVRSLLDLALGRGHAVWKHAASTKNVSGVHS